MESTHPEFPFSKWCKLVEQGNVTLNLLRPYRLNPKLSAYDQVLGALNYQKTLLPSPCMKLLAHVLPIYRCLFELHAIKGLYVGVAMENYRCFKIFISSTGRVRISDTVIWFPHGSLKLPIPYNDELLCSAIDNLYTTIQSSMKKNILPPESTTYIKTLLELNEIFKNCYLRNPNTKTPTPTKVPRVIVQSKDTTIVPWVQLH